MAQVNVMINGRAYSVSCEDGQEAHLLRLGRYLDQRAGELVAAIGQVGESRLLAMVGILIADELSESSAQIKVLKDALEGGGQAAAEQSVADSISRLAARVELLAEKLEKL
jgi:cell division protein ZapA